MSEHALCNCFLQMLHVHVKSRMALICNRVPRRVKLGFSIILRDLRVSSRLRGAHEDVVPHKWHALSGFLSALTVLMELHSDLGTRMSATAIKATIANGLRHDCPENNGQTIRSAK